MLAVIKHRVKRRRGVKKLLQVLAVTVFTAGLSGGAVEAVSCTINGTGPDSTNVCTFDDQTTVEYRCENGVLINNQNNQTVTSGDAQSIDNTSGGDTSSGDATNTNKTLTDVVAACAAAAVTDEEEPKQPKEEAPAPKPEGEVDGAVTQPEQVAALPVTGENNAFLVAASAVIGVGAVAGLSQLGMALYRRRALNM